MKREWDETEHAGTNGEKSRHLQDRVQRGGRSDSACGQPRNKTTAEGGGRSSQGDHNRICTRLRTCVVRALPVEAPGKDERMQSQMHSPGVEREEWTLAADSHGDATRKAAHYSYRVTQLVCEHKQRLNEHDDDEEHRERRQPIHEADEVSEHTVLLGDPSRLPLTRTGDSSVGLG